MVTPQGTFTVRCETCAYRSEWPTRERAVADTLKHRGANLGHMPRVHNPVGQDAKSVHHES